MTRSFRLISILVAMVWSTAALADGGWGTFYLSPAHIEYNSGDPGTACSISAEEQYGTSELGSEARSTANWYTRHCWYQHFLAAGAYTHWFTSTFECPSGQTRVSPGICMAPAQVEDRPINLTDPCNVSGTGGIQPLAGNPVSIANGTKVEVVVDYTSGGINPLEFRRFYRSLMSSQYGQIGMGWTSTYDRRLLLLNSTSVEIYTETGAVEKFAKSGSVWSRSYSDMTGQLAEITVGTVFEFTNSSDRTDRFELVSGSFSVCPETC